MEPVGGNVTKAEVVYYLNQNGKMEPPHMIEVPYLSNEGLRLIDVKRKLTVLRGSAMRNMFSWSYKRSYKNKYIWLDLSEEEIIIPGSSGEYVLKGSELFDDCQDKMKNVSSQKPDCCKHTEVLQNKYRGAESWLKHDVPKSNFDKCQPSFLKHEVTEKCNRFSQENLNEVRKGRHKKFLADSMQTVRRRGSDGLPETDDFLVDNKMSSSSELSDSSTKLMTDIRIFPIKSTIVPARHGCADAATQTNLDNDSCYELALPKKDTEIIESLKPWKFFNNEISTLNQSQAEASIFSMKSGELTSDQNVSHKKRHCKAVDSCLLQDKDSSANLRIKHSSASRVFLQLLSCGGVDTKVQQEMADAEKEGRVSEKKSNLREQLSGLLRSESSPLRKAIDKPATPRGHQALQNLQFPKGIPTAYFCDKGNNHDWFIDSISRISEVDEEAVTALPSPSNDGADLSKLVRRCSSFSSSW